jgi:hypothetical protein
VNIDVGEIIIFKRCETTDIKHVENLQIMHPQVVKPRPGKGDRFLPHFVTQLCSVKEFFGKAVGKDHHLVCNLP